MSGGASLSTLERQVWGKVGQAKMKVSKSWRCISGVCTDNILQGITEAQVLASLKPVKEKEVKAALGSLLRNVGSMS
jgi:hypothetical protein